MDATAASTTEEHVCVICLCAITERASTVPCNHHAFDFICLVTWFQQRSTCPLCKTEVTAVCYDWSSPTSFKTYPVRRTHPPRHTSAPLHSLPRPPRRPRRPYEQPQPDIPVLRRRHVYRRKLYSLHVGSNPLSGHRDVSPTQIAHSPSLQSKARTWIRRELRVFNFLHTDPDGGPSDAGATTSSNAEFLLSYVVALLKKVELKGSNGHAEDLLTEFLGRENARLFLHELNAWMRSPHTKLDQWDREVQYEEELPDRFDGRGLPVMPQEIPNCAELTEHPLSQGMNAHSDHTPD